MPDDDKKKPQGEVVQRYRFRVRTPDGREMVSHVATVTRPAPPTTTTHAPQATTTESPPTTTTRAPENTTTPAPPTTTTQAATTTRAPTTTTQAPPTTTTQAALPDLPIQLILVSITGASQGPFQNELEKNDRKGSVDVHNFALNEFSFATLSLPDEATGEASGKRMHEPVTFDKTLGPSTPQLYQALVSNEVLSEVVFDCFGKDRSGNWALTAHVKLTNASVASMSFQSPNLRDEATGKLAPSHEVTLVFQKVEVTKGISAAVDDWSA